MDILETLNLNDTARLVRYIIIKIHKDGYSNSENNGMNNFIDLWCYINRVAENEKWQAIFDQW